MDVEDTLDEDESAFQELMTLAHPPIEFSPPTLLQLTQLNLPDCGLSSLPANLGTVLPNLSILFCPANIFDELPAVIGSCPSLQMVSFKTNQMKSIHPDALQPQLRWLILTDNKLTSIPKEIGRCTILQKLMLAGNSIQRIPDEISNCTNLELIRLACNELLEPPTCILQLPKLAWLAISDNPFLAAIIPETTTLDVLTDMDEQDGVILGQGASGTTRKVLWKGRPVAVKTYAGIITSDGNPHHEKKLALVASTIESHCLIQVLGQTNDGSLVMELLENYQALSGPPSMESCSRDVYEENQVMSPIAAFAMVNGLLSVLARLHSIGICHGDFYGHNILVSPDENKHVKLCDFGAAFFYDKTKEYGKFIEQIELRAFAILVEEVSRLAKVKDTVSQDLSLLTKLCGATSNFASLQEQWMALQNRNE
jgi:Protein kinase domain/Leucine rich repeat